jgi:sulfate transport system ATP-binding protein
VDGDVVHVGPHQLAHGGADVADGTNVVAFARPHELTISKDPETRGVYAVVERVLTFGATSRIELIGLDVNNEKTPQNYEVELSRLEVAGLNVGEGDHVYLVPRKLSVFEHKGVAA